MPERAAHDPVLPELASEDAVLSDEMADSLPPPPPPCVPALELSDVSTTSGKETCSGLFVPPGTLPGYELQEEIGRGAMGVIYRAWQPALQRTVALKVILAGNLASADQRARFRIEAQAIARFQHPNIVQIFDVGEHQGLAYLVLEYVEGGNLATRINDRPLPRQEAAEIAETLARAVHYAHEHGIVHRDLKPANILLVSGRVVSGESSNSHQPRITHDSPLTIPKITDFGLAKRLDVAGGYTLTDAVLGTPPYMSPEQAAGEEIGPASDIFTLGAILYEMLTGRCPFRARTADETRRLVRESEPVRPRKLNHQVDRELEAICLKCMEKEPARRYATAAALADDLGRWQRGEPVAIRPQGIMRHLRRHPRMATAIAALVIASVIVGAVLHVIDPRRQLDRLQVQYDRGEQVSLISDKGHSTYWRIATKNTERVSKSDRDPLFGVEAMDLGLVELFEMSRQEPFEISAEMRHDAMSRGETAEPILSDLGIFFGHRTRSSEAGVVHVFYKLTFNDLIEQRLGLGYLGNPLRLVVESYRETDRVTDSCPFDPPANSYAPVTFSPFGPWQAEHFRRLVVDVGREKIKVRFDGQFFDVPIPYLEDTVRKMTHPPATPFVFDVRGGMGVCVQRGRGSFRSVTVRPLTDD